MPTEAWAPERIRALVRGYHCQQVTIGRSASSVYLLKCSDRLPLYLKIAEGGTGVAELCAEYQRLIWLASRTTVPTIVEFAVESASRAGLLTRALPGANLAEVDSENRLQGIAEFGRGLRRLHALPIDACPFDQRLDVTLPLARARALAGKVDESDFDEVRQGCRVDALLSLLAADRPASEDVVVTHGDACLPNALVARGHFGGFVDCGRAGLADRHQDLALARRSISENFGPGWFEHFLEAYGAVDLDERKLSYYCLLDEFL